MVFNVSEFDFFSATDRNGIRSIGIHCRKKQKKAKQPDSES